MQVTPNGVGAQCKNLPGRLDEWLVLIRTSIPLDSPSCKFSNCGRGNPELLIMSEALLDKFKLPSQMIRRY